MNTLTPTPTPRTDEWETYCDEWYYHLWRLRRKNERGFNDGFHINNGDEAKGLCDLLNNLETELTAAREEIEMMGIRYAAAEMHHANNMQEVTEQRDRLVEALERIADYQGRFAEEDPKSIATEALQSINQTTEP